MLTEDEFSDLDDTDTFGEMDTITLRVVIASHRPIEQQEISTIYLYLEDKITDYGNIKEYEIIKTTTPYHFWENSIEIFRAIHQYKSKYEIAIDIELFDKYDSDETLQMLKQFTGIHQTQDIIWTTNNQEIISAIESETW